MANLRMTNSVARALYTNQMDRNKRVTLNSARDTNKVSNNLQRWGSFIKMALQ